MSIEDSLLRASEATEEAPQNAYAPFSLADGLLEHLTETARYIAVVFGEEIRR